jgi:hypothetical protein
LDGVREQLADQRGQVWEHVVDLAGRHVPA